MKYRVRTKEQRRKEEAVQQAVSLGYSMSHLLSSKLHPEGPWGKPGEAVEWMKKNRPEMAEELKRTTSEDWDGRGWLSTYLFGLPGDPTLKGRFKEQTGQDLIWGFE